MVGFRAVQRSHYDFLGRTCCLIYRRSNLVCGSGNQFYTGGFGFLALNDCRLLGQPSNGQSANFDRHHCSWQACRHDCEKSTQTAASYLDIKYMNIVRSILFLGFSFISLRFFLSTDGRPDYLYVMANGGLFLLIGILCYLMARQCKKYPQKAGNAYAYRFFVAAILISMANIIIPFAKLI